MHPAFICIGAQKAGTDWVYDQFEAHRDFWMPPIKEIAFFDKAYGPRRFAKAEQKLDRLVRRQEKGKGDFTAEIAFLQRMLGDRPKPWTHDFTSYFGLFEDKPGRSGDCTPGYSRLEAPMVAQMLGQMPDTRFLLVLRDPAERLWSQAQMHKRLGRDDDATDSLAAFTRFADKPHVRRLSFFADTVRTWQELDAGQGRFAVFFFDDLRTDAEAYRAAIAAHVGADPGRFTLPAGHNKKAAQPGKRALPAEYRTWLAGHFAEEYRTLAGLLGGPAARWLDTNETILAG